MAQAPTTPPIYVAYWLYKLDPSFTRLPDAEQQSAKRDWLAALEARPASVTLRGTYSFAGLRADADLMLWVLSEDLDALQGLAVTLRQTRLGRALDQVETYIGVTSAPRYDPQHAPAFMLEATPKNFVSVYPFVKTTEWYLLGHQERGTLMAEHGLVGRKYAVPRSKLVPAPATEMSSGAATATAVLANPATATEAEEGGGVLSNTVDSFGLGDYEFILANESDDASELCRMMMALRATEVRRYTQLDVPIFLGRLRPPAEVLETL